MSKLSRDELIEVTDRLMNARVSSDAESNRLGRLFKDNIRHPAGTDLIFFWDKRSQAQKNLLILLGLLKQKEARRETI